MFRKPTNRATIFSGADINIACTKRVKKMKEA